MSQREAAVTQLLKQALRVSILALSCLLLVYAISEPSIPEMMAKRDGSKH